MDKNICDICGGNYILKDGHLVCEKCGHYASSEVETTEGTDFINHPNNEITNNNIEEKEINDLSFDNEKNKDFDSFKKENDKELFNLDNFELNSNDNDSNDITLIELGTYYESNFNQDLEQKLKVGYSLLVNGLYKDAKNVFSTLLNANSNQRVKIAEILADKELTSINELINNEELLFANLDLLIEVIDVSSKEDSIKYLKSLIELIDKLINKFKFKNAYDIYSRICNYNTDVILKLHGEIVENVANFFNYEQEIYSIIDLALKHIISNKKEYSNVMFNLIISLVNIESSSDEEGSEIPELRKYYNQARRELPDDYAIMLCEYCIKGKDVSVNDALAKCLISFNFDYKSRIDSMSKENANKFLNLLGNVINKNLLINEDFINNYKKIEQIIYLILSYDFEDKSKFIDNLLENLLECPVKESNGLFDDLVSLKYSKDSQEYLDINVEYTKGLLNSCEFESAKEYANRILTIDSNNSNALMVLFLGSMNANNANVISKKIISLQDFTYFEKVLNSFENEEKKNIFITNISNVCIQYIITEENYNPELNKDIFNVFDKIISYFSENSNENLIIVLKLMADNCLKNKLFEEAEKYYSMIITIDQNQYLACWGLLQARLKCTCDDELIKQSTLIGNLPEFVNALIGTANDQATYDRFIECKAKQEQYLQNKENEEKIKKETEIKNKKKKKILIISGIVVATVALIATVTTTLTINVFIPMNIYNDSLSLINDGKYEEAYDKLDTINKEGYKDKEKQKTICKAGIAFSEGDFEKGISYFTSAGGKINVDYDAAGGKVDKNNETLSNENKNYFINDLTINNHVENDFQNKEEVNNFINNDPSRDGYNFTGWKISEFKITTSENNYKCDLSLKASYSTITYSISYDLNNGTCENLPATYNVESEDFTLSEPSKTGYTFIGWSGTGINGTQKNVVIPKGSIGDRSYVANYKANKYKVILDYGYNSIKKEVEVTYDSYYKFDEPIKNAYSFAYWEYNGTKLAQEGTWKIPNDVTLTAHYDAIKYQIKYNLNGGTHSNPTSYTIETSTFSLSAPTKTGYTFIGWSGTGINGTQKNVTIIKGSSGDKEYTANYTANTYTITLDYQDGKTTKPKTVTYDSYYNLSEANRDGYKFKYWTYNGSQISTTGTWKIAGNVTLYAVYDVEEYSIYYDLNGGTLPSGYSNPSTYTVETATFTLKEPTKTGYTFVGWTSSDVTTPTKNYQIKKGSYNNKYLTANYETNVYLYQTENSANYSTISVMYNKTYSFDKPTAINGYQFVRWYYYKNNSKVYIENSGTWTYEGNLRLYAEWTKEYSISYDLDEGSFVSGSTALTKYTALTDTFTIPDAYKEGYEFLGWSLGSKNESSASKNYKVNKGTTGNLIFYANFKKIENQTPTE